MKLLYIVNLIYSYRIVGAPALNCLDTFVLKIKESDRDEDEYRGEDEQGQADEQI